MKTRESEMPEEKVWRSFFDPETILTVLGLTRNVRDAVDFGCGYGSFAIPAVRRIQGTLYGFDIEPEMIEICESYAQENDIRNARFNLRDFVTEGAGLPPDSVDYAMLFNILHAENPLCLLREA